jgi:hypothetical protein
MIQPTNDRSGLRPRHGVIVVGSVVLAAIIAYAAFGFIVGTFWFLVKLAVVVGVGFLVVKMLFRRNKPSS